MICGLGLLFSAQMSDSCCNLLVLVRQNFQCPSSSQQKYRLRNFKNHKNLHDDAMLVVVVDMYPKKEKKCLRSWKLRTCMHHTLPITCWFCVIETEIIDRISSDFFFKLEFSCQEWKKKPVQNTRMLNFSP